MKTPDCPKGHGPMEKKQLEKEKTFKGVDIRYTEKAYVCPECGLEAGTVETAGAVQRAIADAYRSQAGLLTSREIKSLREAKGLTQQQLADAMNVGIASVKRWETGMVQSKSMDHALRIQLQQDNFPHDYTGNRQIDLSRIKLVARTFEGILGKRLLKVDDKFLFMAKYLWYADMLAYRKLGKGMTGASYAAITYGPQLNNYKDLVKPIKESDENETEPLSEEEVRIIRDLAEKFPTERDVYDAAHRETVCQNAPTGSLISYTRAGALIEV